MKLQYERNCNFLNKKELEAHKSKKSFTLVIGFIKYESCPYSLIKYPEVFSDIAMVDWSESSGIPIHGTCLADQSPYTLEVRAIVLSERARLDYETDFGMRDDKDKGKGESKTAERIDNIKKLPKENIQKMIKEGEEESNKYKKMFKSPLKDKRAINKPTRKPRRA